MTTDSNRVKTFFISLRQKYITDYILLFVAILLITMLCAFYCTKSDL